MHLLEVFLLRMYMRVLKLVTQWVRLDWPGLVEGPGSSLELCRQIAKDGHQRVLLVTDAGLTALGMHEPLCAELRTQGLDVRVYDGVEPDPSIAQVNTGFAVLQEFGAQAVLALGGGSSIDAAKVIAAMAQNQKTVRDMVGLFKARRGMLPLYVIPTTAGTGSEVTVGAVISDPVAQQKLLIADPKLMPRYAALDGELMCGLPPGMTAATGMDALTHAVEAFLSRNATAETDAYAVSAGRVLFHDLEVAYAHGDDPELRQRLARAAHLAGRAITKASLGYVHAIAHNFGARYHLPHGLANAIVMPHVLDYSLPCCRQRMAAFARACGVSNATDDLEAALALISRVRAMNNSFGIPAQVESLKAEDIPAIARAARAEARFLYPVPRYLTQASAEQLIRHMQAA